MKQIIYFLLQIEFIAAVFFQALYLTHIREDKSTAAILFSGQIKGEGKFLSELIFHAKINLEYKILPYSEYLSFEEGPTATYCSTVPEVRGRFFF